MITSNTNLRLVSVLFVVVCLWSSPAIATADPAKGLTLAARVWGLAKYHHPDVTQCALDWDQVLLDQFEQLEQTSSGSQAERSTALTALLDAAGTLGTAALTDQTPEWIRDADIDTPLKKKLAWLERQTPEQQCYVATSPLLDFGSDRGHFGNSLFPDRAHRALAAFRFWNVIEYFFPYKDIIGQDWAQVLEQWLPPILNADNRVDYIRAIRVLTAAIRDDHSFLRYFFTPDLSGLYPGEPPPFAVRRIEGEPVVVLVSPQADSKVHPGDIVLAVDGETVAARAARWDAMGYGSNPVSRDFTNLRRAMRGKAPLGRYRFRRPDGVVYEIQLKRSWAHDSYSLQGIETAWERRSLPGGCEMGIVNLRHLQPEQVDQMVRALADTDAIVFDVRNYPNETIGPLADYLFPQPKEIAHFTLADLHNPGTVRHTLGVLGGEGAPLLADKRLLVLFDERTQSQAEFTVMGLQATGNAIAFGSQTAGADGNITSVTLPGHITAVFTGLGVYYPDGRSTQRIGIVPDVHVTPTIHGLAAGSDEVLAAALDCKWVQETPKLRIPPTGLYYDLARSGEGIDIHYDGQSVTAYALGYDEQGQPTWLLAGAPASAAHWGSQFHSYRGNATAPVYQSEYSLDSQRGPYAPACAIADQSALHPRALWKAPGIDSAGRCVTPLILSTGGRVAGLWMGPPGDTGWGVSIYGRGENLSVILYGYDTDGYPRWLMGTGVLGNNGVAEIALRRYTGFCRTCAPKPVTSQPAGSIRFALHSSQDGMAEADIEAWFGSSETPWIRIDVALRRLVGE